MAYSDLAVLAAFGTFFVFLLIFLLVVWIFQSLGLFFMAKRQGIPNAWLAFLPIGSQYVMGKLAGSIRISDNVTVDAVKVLLYGMLALFVLCFIPIINMLAALLSLGYSIFYYMVLYKIYKDRRPQSAVLFLVLSIIPLTSFIAMPVILLMLRNDPVIVPAPPTDPRRPSDDYPNHN